MSNQENAGLKLVTNELGKEESRRQGKLAGELYERYGLLVHHLLHVFSLPQQYYYDLFNQIFMKIVKGLNKIKHLGNVKSWIIKIARNEIINFYDKLARDARVIVWDGKLGNEQGIIKRLSSSLLPTEEEICHEQLRVAFQKYVSELEDEIREPFILRYEKLLKWREIGEILGLSIDTARNRAMKAQKKVIKRLESMLKFKGPYS